MHRVAVILVCALAFGCQGDATPGSDREARSVVRDSAGIQIVDSQQPAWEESERWQIGAEPLFIIRGSDGGPENRLLDPTSIDVDARSRIIIGDGDQAGWDAVLVYDSVGRFVFQAGKEGEGPGEFGQLWWAQAYRGDSIVAFDMSGDKINVFDPDGEFARLARVPVVHVPEPPPGTYGFTAGADAAYADGHFLAYPLGHLDVSGGVGPAWYRHLLLRLSPDGTAWDTLGSFRISQQYWTGTQQEPLWYAPWSIHAVGTTDLFYGSGETFEIRRYDEQGRLSRIIRRAYESRPVTEALREQLEGWYMDLISSSPGAHEGAVEQVREQFESAKFTQVLPSYSAMLLDDEGFLWVEHFRWIGKERAPTVEPATWSVFDAEGTWLGEVSTPPGFILRAVTPDRALGFMVSELGVREVHVYPLDRRG